MRFLTPPTVMDILALGLCTFQLFIPALWAGATLVLVGRHWVDV